MEKHNDIRSPAEIRQAQREAAEKFAAAKERGDLAAAESALNEFSEQMRAFREPLDVLGPNFLGVAAWQNIGVDVGAAPPLPQSLTLEFLKSDCPLHPGQKIKDTHLLVLIPKTVNRKPYTGLQLDELCETRRGSGNRLIQEWSDWMSDWKETDLANAARVQSEWVLLPKSDPDPEVSPDKHFRNKDIAAQQKVHKKYYGEYREAKTLELMTAVLLYDLNHNERLLPECYLRCEEHRGQVTVGPFDTEGLLVFYPHEDEPDEYIGRALARKL